jgi:hypothetical protein
MNNGFQMDFFGSEERKSGIEVEPQLIAENTQGASAGTVILRHTMIEDVLH